MSEISREEHKHLINEVVKIRDMERRASIDKETDRIKALTQAISDMEKLEKIEKALGTTCLSENNEKCDYDGDCEIHTLKVIEQIVKG